MSSSYIIEPQEGGSKKDDTLILMVNDNGVISVDQDTLQSLILNQSNATVSVVRLGQTDKDAEEGNITLTVDPPSYVPPETDNVNSAVDATALVDPFMEMDPEQLERLETALQSEEAKQILGENVTAMLDMLTVEEQQNSIRYIIELDHCYTSRFSPSQPKPADPLPDVNATEMDESMCIDLNKSTIHTPMLLPVSSANVNNSSAALMKQKITPTPPKIVKQPVSIGGRPRRASAAMQPNTTNPKSTISTNSRTMLNAMQDSKTNAKDDGEPEGNELFSSESSESEESDSDSDFGPRPSRRGVRARGGRRGLTTRGGSMAASRKRGANKQMDSEQVRRLDLEMAAAVNAMKSPEKEDKSDKLSPGKNKKQVKSLPAKKKDDTTPVVPISETPPIETNVLQTTNQVKANLISANMFKGDMILTKPGQDRNNQKVVFVQKQVIMNPNDIKTFGIKKQVIIPKTKVISPQISKVPTNKDVKITSVTTPVKVATPVVQQQVTVQQSSPPVEVQTENIQKPLQSQKVVSTAIVKMKPAEVKKEKKKVDTISETVNKVAAEPLKPIETKSANVPKKIVKKDHRKSDTHVVESLGPALFSTPDIIRRVGSISESRVPESPTTPVAAMSLTTGSITSVPTTITLSNPISISTSSLNTSISSIHEPMDISASTNDTIHDSISAKLEGDASILSESIGDDKLDSKVAIADLLQPALDPTSNPTPSKEEKPSTMEQSNNTKNVVPESSIDGDEHLLATLGMEAAKQLPNDEELLAEALLLQETLGVDLDHNPLVDAPPHITEPILSSSIMESVAPIMVTSLAKQEPAPIGVSSSSATKPVITAPQNSIVSTVKNEQIVKKDSKEPIQIIRGGRVITLPPIEAPATRSKRLQAKAENQVKVEKKEQKPHVQQHQQQQLKVEPLIIKTERSARTPSHVSLRKQDMIYDMEDDEEEEEEPNSDSEDDPNRLWCICRQPHNNRFMICCDMCQDWFHGKCVHVTKVMGEQMENEGIEWVCPNCSKKKEESKPKVTPRRQKSSEAISHEQNRVSAASNSSTTETKIATKSGKNSGTSSGVTHCVVCKKEARSSSIYCSDACILQHAEVTTTKDKSAAVPPVQVKTSKPETPKLKSDVRIIVYEKKTGKFLTGADAPTTSNLKTWLKEHPTYEVVKSNNLNTIQLGGKTVAAIQTQGIKTNKPLHGSKAQGQAKMVYAHVAGSKQTILAPSTKKTVLLADTPPTPSTASPQHRSKQITAAKTPTTHLKQTSIKASLQNQQQQQNTLHKPAATSTPKTVSTKKPHDTKPSTSQQKHPHHNQQVQNSQQQTVTKTVVSKKPETEPIRLNVRKILAEVLSGRIKEAKDITLTEEEIVEIALQIELEMFKFFKDTGAKYKTKYRALVFNIKDTKNLTLFRKIADRSLSPDAVVKLSADEMASQELAEWREKENKHQLEMIKKNELDLMAQAKSIVVKTHKGEQIIENDDAIDRVDPKTPVQDIVTALNSGESITSTMEDNKSKEDSFMDQLKKSKLFEDEKDKKKKEKDRDREKRRDRSRDKTGKDISKRDRSLSKERYRHSKDRGRERSRERKLKKDGKHKDRDRTKDKDKEHDKSRERDKKKDKDKNRRDKHKRSRSISRSHSKSRHKDHKEKHKKEKDKKKDALKNESSVPNLEKSIEDRLWRHIEDETTTMINTLDGNDSDVSDREPSSTVTIKTPDMNEEIDKDILEPKANETAKGVMTVWRGFVHMTDLAKFYATAQNVSGNCKQVMETLPESFTIRGRIDSHIVWEYIRKLKMTNTKEILIIKLIATNDEEKIPYITLYSYLNSHNKLGALGSVAPNIKDFYIMPFPNGSKLPSVLLPLNGPGIEENRQHLLLGLIVVQSRKKRLDSMPSTPIPAKIAKKEQPSGSSNTPPPLQLMSSYTKDENMTPPTTARPSTQIRIVTQEVKQTFSVIAKIVPELSSKITLESSSSSDKMQLDDEDEPYSPGEPVDVNLDDDEDALSSSSSLKLPQPAADSTAPISPIKSSSDLQRKMEELSRQIEEEKQQIQNISSSFLSDASTTLPGLGLDPPDSGEPVEAYSPSDARSFTPPPQGISKLTQPILEKVSNITIPPNLQEILANVKRQESSKVDPYLPSKPSATFLTTVNSAMYQNQEKYSPMYSKTTSVSRLSSEVQSSPRKETKSTLSSLSDYDIMKKAEEELAALAAATAASGTLVPSASASASVSAPMQSTPSSTEPPPPGTSFDAPHR